MASLLESETVVAYRESMNPTEEDRDDQLPIELSEEDFS